MFVIIFILSFAIFIFGLIVYSLTLQWIDKLEKSKCKCSENFKRDFIKYFLYLYFAFIAINFTVLFIALTYGIYLGYTNSKPNRIIVMLASVLHPIWKLLRTVIMPMLLTVNIIFSILYISGLKQLHSKLECLCSKDVRADIYYYWNIFLLAFAAFILLAMGVMYFIMYIAK